MTGTAACMLRRYGVVLSLAIVAALSPPSRAAQPVAQPAAQAPGQPASAPSSDLVAKGKYLAIMGDCEACHTAPNGTPFAGGLEMDTPFGKLPTPNITPDAATGIGKYSDDQFVRVFHQGIGRDGQYLYPVMPFPWYTKVTRDDILAIKAYLFSLPPVHAPRKPLQIVFPFNVRAGLAVWDQLFLVPGVFKPDPSKSAQINRGAYVVEGLGHCGECHDSNNLLGAGAAAKPLQGGEIDHWYAPNITSDVRTGIGRFTDDQLFTYLETGTAVGLGTVVGPMAQTQHESLSKLTDDDLRAIVAYLKSTPATPSFSHYVLATTGQGAVPGVQAYLNHCASCHQLDGKGITGVVPTLVGNGTVKSGGPETVIRVVLGGVEAQGSYGPMPAVGSEMSDQDVADATNYVRAAWSNETPATAGPGEVADLRKLNQTFLSGTLPGDACPTLAQPDVAKLSADSTVQALLHSTTADNMLQTANRIVAKVKADAPHVAQADLVNGLTIAYCPIVIKDARLSPAQRIEQLGQFAETIYTQLSQKGQD